MEKQDLFGQLSISESRFRGSFFVNKWNRQWGEEGRQRGGKKPAPQDDTGKSPVSGVTEQKLVE